jgi:hypothetical protein
MTTFSSLRLALQVFQSNRLRRDYHDLAQIPQYKLIGEFFFTELYGPRDFSRRDAEARRLQHLLHVLPGVHIRDIEDVLELLELTHQLDDGLTRLLLNAGVTPAFDEAAYEQYYREADNYTQRLRQLELIRSCLYNIFRLSRSHLLGIALHRSGLIVRLAGFEMGHDFLVKAYDALQGVTSIDLFADTIFSRELSRLDRIYERDL